MTVDVRVIHCGRKSEVKTLRNERTSRNVRSICKVSIFLKSIVMLRAKSIRTEMSNSSYSMHVFASRNGLLTFNSILILPFSWWDV